MPVPDPVFQDTNNPSGPEVTFRTQNILPPGAVYVAADDALQLDWFQSSQAVGGPAALTIRLLTPDGIIVPSVYTINIVAGTNASLLIAGSEGFLLSANLVTQDLFRGLTFFRFYVIRGKGGLLGGQGQVFFAGYSTGHAALGYPQSPIEPAHAGRGFTVGLNPGSPGPGGDFTVAVPNSDIWRIISVQAVLGTSAAVSNRLPELVFTGTGNWNLVLVPTFTVPASLSAHILWGDGVAAAAVSNVFYVPIPREIYAPPGLNIKSVTGGIQAGDQWSAIALVVEQWVSG